MQRGKFSASEQASLQGLQPQPLKERPNGLPLQGTAPSTTRLPAGFTASPRTGKLSSVCETDEVFSSPSPVPPRGKQVRRLPIHLAANAVCGPLPKVSGAQSGAAAEIAPCLLLPPAAAGRDPLRKCPSLACISQSRTTTGWIKGGEKSPPLPFQLGGFQRGEEIGIFPPLACFLFLSTFSLHAQRENGH